MKSFSFKLLASVSVLLVLELFGRVADTIHRDVVWEHETAPEPWLVDSPTLGWQRKPGYEGSVGGAERKFDDDGYFAADSEQIVSASGKKRVVFIGDSNTFGFGVPTPSSFVEVADHLLPNVDAINLGVVGYSSFQGRVVLEEQLPILKPDLVVVSFNFNDRRYALPSGGPDGPEQFQDAYRASHGVAARILSVLELSHFYRGLRVAMRKAGLAPSPVEEVDVLDLQPRVDEASYRSNLSQIVADTKRLRIPLLFIVLRDDPIQSDPVKRGVWSLAQGDYDMAIAYLHAGVREHTMFSELSRLYLAKAYEAKGDSAGAAKAAVSHSVYRSFSGGTLIRLDTDYNDIMREVAAENQVDVLNGAELLEQDPSVFIDFCHFNVEGHRRLGEALASRISDMLANRHRH